MKANLLKDVRTKLPSLPVSQEKEVKAGKAKAKLNCKLLLPMDRTAFLFFEVESPTE
jgi:hypothetical protein